MSFILNIDTATEIASVALAESGITIASEENIQQKDHAAWIHTAVQNLATKTGVPLNDLKAVAVTAGPGSYTGLRVGMATAKGFCFALNIPLITESTLKVMAFSAANHLQVYMTDANILLCPMIDARRMEVFTAVFNAHLEEQLAASAQVLTAESFKSYLTTNDVIFVGSGSGKFRQLISTNRAKFLDIHHSANELAALSHKKFLTQTFDDVAYAEPTYLKEFYTVPKK